jgi:catechol 2,3-dioxygenase-like lactoylglutathione lyase family enzyme
MNITGSNVTIMVKNVDKSISFYESIGLKLKQRWGDHYAMVEGPGITLGIHPHGTDEPNSGTVSIGFMIDNIDEVKSLLEKNNITFKSEDDGKSGIYAHFKDPDGTILYFVKPKW